LKPGYQLVSSFLRGTKTKTVPGRNVYSSWAHVVSTNIYMKRKWKEARNIDMESKWKEARGDSKRRAIIFT
jgi:hypothetical protein